MHYFLEKYEDSRETLMLLLIILSAVLSFLLAILLIKYLNRTKNKSLKFTQPVAMDWKERKKLTTQYYLGKLISTPEYEKVLL